MFICVFELDAQLHLVKGTMEDMQGCLLC